MDINLIDYKTRRLIPAIIQEKKKILCIKFAYNANVKNDIKGCHGSTWEPSSKSWLVTHPRYNVRNAVVLGYLSNGLIPNTIKDPFKKLSNKSWPIETSRPLRDYQREDISRALAVNRAMLAHEMGLGKTLCAIEFMEHVHRYIERHYLNKSGESIVNHYSMDQLFWVVSPLAPLKEWQVQLPAWESKVVPKLIGAEQSRIRKAMEEATIAPICLILDESSRYKYRTSLRSQYILTLSELMAKEWNNDHYILELTGTPSPKDPTNWHNQIEIIWPGYIKERDKSQFRNRLAYTSVNEGQYGSYINVEGWKVDEISKLRDQLKPIVLTRFKADVAKELPEKIYQKVNFELTPKVLRLAGLILAEEGEGLRALERLRELSDGFQYTHTITDDGRKIRTGYNNFYTPKDIQLIEDLASLSEEEETRCVIFAGFSASIDKCVEIAVTRGWSVIRVDGRGWNMFKCEEHKDIPMEASLKQFQQDNLDQQIAYIGNPRAGGMGVTLTRSKIAIYYSNDFNGESRMQSEDRIHRLGIDENRAPTIKDYIWLPTDQQVLDNLQQKKDLQSLSLKEIASVYEKYKLEL